jgi:hypothetical protein
LSKKLNVVNTTPLPTIASGELAEVDLDETVQRYLDTGALVIEETAKKGKDQ